MAQNLPEVGPLFGHCLGSGLAESDAMPLAGSGQNEMIVFLLHSEVIAWHRGPAQLTIDIETCRLIGTAQ